MGKAWMKSCLREILHSFGRFLAILSIIALGVGFFSGLKVTKKSMIATGDKYVSDTNMYDYKFISTFGFRDEDLSNYMKSDDIEFAEGAYFYDFIGVCDDTEKVLSAHSITPNINKLSIVSGRLPKNDEECVVDALKFNEDIIGQYIQLSDRNTEETINKFNHKLFKVVGTVNSVNYLNIERGTSKLGLGTVNAFIYMNKNAFSSDIYTEMYVTLKNKSEIFGDEYKHNIENLKSDIECDAQECTDKHYNDIRTDLNNTISEAEETYSNKLNEYNDNKQKAQQDLNDTKNDLDNKQKIINDVRNQLIQKQSEAEEALIDLNDKSAIIDSYLSNLNNDTEQYKELMGQKADLQFKINEINDKMIDLNSKIEELNEKQNEIDDGFIKYNDLLKQSEDYFNDLKVNLDNAKSKIEEYKDDLNNLKKPVLYCVDRSYNTGYMCFDNDSGIVEGIAKVFPIFFFLVAALVCSTTMTRMVDEQRTQMGTLKALGYSNGRIIFKYVLYSGLAAVIGCIVGFYAGCRLFPYTIWHAYKMLYNFADIMYVFDMPLFIISLVVSLLCSVGSAYIACRTEITRMPSELMRPKSPKSGKRIILEHINFIWKHMSFLHKVSARNILRYKKRLIMMILGIGGCTALVLTGFGVKDSIGNIVSDQYDHITKYDCAITFMEPQNEADMNQFKNNTSDMLDKCIFICSDTAEINESGLLKKINIVATSDSDISSVISLHEDSVPIDYPEFGCVVLSRKICEESGLKVGDIVHLNLSDNNEAQLKLSGIADNYVYNYAYMTAETYEKYISDNIEYNTAYVTSANNDVHSVSANLMSNFDISSILITSDMRTRVNNMMKSLNYVVWLVIACAGALAFVVLFDLSSINITEREREIATIKVLGFYSSETGAYVFRENIVLTILGSIIGIPLGIMLHSFVMSQINIDIVSFNIRIMPISYIYSIIITLGFTVFVDLLMRHRINKISMSESLKSIE